MAHTLCTDCAPSETSILRHYGLLGEDAAPRPPALPEPHAWEEPEGEVDPLLARARALVRSLHLADEPTGAGPSSAAVAPPPGVPLYGSALGVSGATPATVFGRRAAEEDAARRRLEFSTWGAGTDLSSVGPDAQPYARDGDYANLIREVREAASRAQEAALGYSGES